MATSQFRLATVGIAALVVLLIAGAILWSTPGHSEDHRDPASVTASGTELRLDDESWWPSGFNAYQLATDWSVNAGCGAEVDLDEFFAALPRRSLTRFSLFEPFTVRKDDGTIDYSAADAVFAAAERHGQLVLPVLSSGDGTCDGGRFKTADWYREGWRRQPLGAHGTYLDWLRAAVNRWKSSPALAGWTAVGEAEPSLCQGAACSHWQTRTCPADAPQILRTFFDAVGAEIAALDPGRLRFAGLVGAGQCGTAGEGFTVVGASPGLDVLEFHDYSLDRGPGIAEIPPTEAVPARMQAAQQLNKPLFVAEIGLKAGSCLPITERAERMRSMIDTQRRLGTAGALAWAYVPDPRPSECTYDIGPDDPLWPDLLPTDQN